VIDDHLDREDPLDAVVAVFRLCVAVLALIATHEIWLEGDMDALVYFTNQSGLMLAVLMTWGAWAAAGRAGLVPARWRAPEPVAWFAGAVTLYLAITGLIAHFVLDPPDPNLAATFLGLTSAQIEHQITPVAAVVDFVLFAPHRRLRLRHALLWLTYLYAYAVFALIRAELLAEPDYPYGFIDLGELGWGGLAANIAMYSVIFAVLGCVLVGIDRLLRRRALIGSAQTEPADDGARPAPDGAAPPSERSEAGTSAART